MSSTEATMSSSSGESNGNGKRERSPSIEVEVAPNTKQLRSSDDSDEKETEDGPSSSDTDPTLPDTVDKYIAEAPEGEKDVTTESTDTDVSITVAEKDTVGSENNNANISKNDEPIKDEMIQIDRAGDSTLNENHSNPPPAMTQPSLSNATASAADPRVAGATAASSNTSSTPQAATTTTTAAATTSTSTSDPRVATPATATSTSGAGGGGGVSNVSNGVDPNVRATLSNPDQLVEERGEVSALYVGRVIGKGGEMIRDLQARSGARIDVDQNVPAGQPRVITYRGTRSTVDFAKRLVQMLSTEGVHENDLPLGHASQELLIIPAPAVGKVIGRGGEMIRELQSRSQAKIQIDHSGQSGIPTDQKQVTITGTVEAVVKAKEMVLMLVANPLMDAQQSLNMLMDDKIRRNGQWGSGPPYMNLPNQGINMQPHMVSPQFQAVPQGYGGYPATLPATAHIPSAGYPPVSHQQPQVPPSYGGPSSSLGGGGPMVGGYRPPHQQQQLPPQQQQHHSAYAQFGGGGDGRENDVFYAPKQFMGRIIGGKGVTVNDLQRRSGCDIQINQDVAPGLDCEITLKGTRQGIESAKAMIQEIIDVGPQHPYAGGMDSYGGGGGPPSVGGGGGYHGAYAQPQQYLPYQQPQQGYDQGAYGQAAHMPPGVGYGQPTPQAVGGGYGQHPVQQYGGYAPPAAVPPRQAHPQVSAWKTATAPDGQVYYYNERTGETQWEKPAGMP